VYDVIVSGAGPAGSSAALGCAREGLRTLLLEKHDLPRSKCCAGGILGRALDRLELTIPDRLVESRITGFTIVNEDFRREVEFDRPAGITVRRREFDAHISDAAGREGATILDNTAVMGVRENTGSLTVVTGDGEFSCRFLVIGEGAASRTARKVLGPVPGGSLALGMASMVELDSSPGGSIEIHLFDTPTSRIRFRSHFPMNGWMFPLNEGANIGVVGRGIPAEKLRGRVTGMARQLQAEFGGGEEPIVCSAPLPTVPRRSLVKGRCLVVGDAAGFLNQITGEGMTYALESGRLASRAILTAARNGDGDLSNYQRWCDDAIRPDLTATSLMGPVLHWLIGVVDTDRFFDVFCSHPGMVSSCLGIARGEESWTALFLKCVQRFPRLFFTSLT
jgi:geranylgeranyl reductase family protein